MCTYFLNHLQPLKSVSKVASHLVAQKADMSAVDIYEGNMGDNGFDMKTNKPPRRKHLQRHSLPGFLDSSKSYQVRKLVKEKKFIDSACFLVFFFSFLK